MTTTAKDPAQWLGLLLRSESSRPHEWPFLACVVINRMRHSKRWPDTVHEVVLQPWQFSYFNTWKDRYQTGSPDEMTADQIFHEAAKGYAGDSGGWGANDLQQATQCAREMLNTPQYRMPFDVDVYYFWSPQSMRPQGSHPSWVRNDEGEPVLEVFSMEPAILSERWVFARRTPKQRTQQLDPAPGFHPPERIGERV